MSTEIHTVHYIQSPEHATTRLKEGMFKQYRHTAHTHTQATATGKYALRAKGCVNRELFGVNLCVVCV